MKKLTSAGSVVAAVVLASMGVMGTAHATDTTGSSTGDSSTPQVSPPKDCSTTGSRCSTEVSPPKSETVQSKQVEAASVESLPNTGGPNEVLLGGALALMAAGGATVVVARRRQTT